MEEHVGPLIFLSDDELDIARNASPTEQRRLFVAGFVDFSLGELVLYRADESEIVAPLHMFKPTKAGVVPDFEKFELIDHGLTVKLGEYEASSSSILYDIDSEYKAFCDTNRMIN
jgi:hypothetical protein